MVAAGSTSGGTTARQAAARARRGPTTAPGGFGLGVGRRNRLMRLPGCHGIPWTMVSRSRIIRTHWSSRRRRFHRATPETTSARAYPANRYMHRNHMGRNRTLYNLPCGSRQTTAAAMPPIRAMNRATRLRRITMATRPTRSAASTQRAEPGKSRWGKPSTLVQPMLVVYAPSATNGSSHHAVSPVPNPPATTDHTSRRDHRRRAGRPSGNRRTPRNRSASSRSHRTAPATANRAGSRWQRRVAAKRQAARARCLPVRRPDATTPRKSRASERLSENENSPARVDRRFPP